MLTPFKAEARRPLTKAQRQANAAFAAMRCAVEGGFAALKAWRILDKLRLNPRHATMLVRALLVLTQHEQSIRDTARPGHDLTVSTPGQPDLTSTNHDETTPLGRSGPAGAGAGRAKAAPGVPGAASPDDVRPGSLDRHGHFVDAVGALRAPAKPLAHRDSTCEDSSEFGFALVHDGPGPPPDISSEHGPS